MALLEPDEEPPEDEPPLDDDVELVLVVLWPWKDFAAAAEMATARTTAPVMIHRLIRPIRAKPASRALTAFLCTLSMMGQRGKKRLSRG